MSEQMHRTERAYVAIGVPMGASPNANTRDFETEQCVLLLRVGDRFIALDRYSAAAWIRAATPTGLSKLIEDGTQADVEELIAAGLLVEFPDSGQQSRAASGGFFDLVALPLSLIVGGSPENKDAWTIGNWKGEPLLRLGMIDYLIWSQLTGRASIGEAVTATATAIEQPAQELIPRVAPLFAALLATRAIALDRR
ncbi:MAG: hypothetical protein ACLP50_31745 [Solirubrobacteraceae bacterium]